jgi:hypothetical protein
MQWAEFYADTRKSLEAHQAAVRAQADALDRKYEQIGEALENGIVNHARRKDYNTQTGNS